MTGRKRLQNQRTFKFEESDVLPAPSVSALYKKRSVQERLVPKVPNVGSGSRAQSDGEKILTKSLSAVALSPTPSNNNHRYSPRPPRRPAVAGSDPALDHIVAKLKSGSISCSSEQKSGLGQEEKVDCHCQCERGPQLVLCSLCGATSTGRVAIPCPSHPRIVFLQDLRTCPACLTGGLDSLKEFPLPRGMMETLGNVKKA